MFDKKQKSCVKRIHLVTDDGLYNRKAFCLVKIVFYSSSMNDGEFINYHAYIICYSVHSLYETVNIWLVTTIQLQIIHKE